MEKRTVYSFGAVLLTLVIMPIFAYATFRSDSQLDQFLQQRTSLLNQLDANALSLPIGVKHVIRPQGNSLHPGDVHIRSVVRNGQLWAGDIYSSYDFKIIGPAREESPIAVVKDIIFHLSSGMEKIGLRSPKSGGPDSGIGNGRAAHSSWWCNSDRSLIVTISVVVDMESHSAHVTRYVHERFD